MTKDTYSLTNNTYGLVNGTYILTIDTDNQAIDNYWSTIDKYRITIETYGMTFGTYCLTTNNLSGTDEDSMIENDTLCANAVSFERAMKKDKHDIESAIITIAVWDQKILCGFNPCSESRYAFKGVENHNKRAVMIIN
jgi:hypothetical protein